MNDLQKIKKYLEDSKGWWPAIETETKITQRTMYNIINDKMPRYQTIETLLGYFETKPKRGSK